MRRWGFLMVLATCSSQNPVDLYGQWENPDKRLTNYPAYFDYGSYNNAWTIAVRDTMVHIVWEHRNPVGTNPGELYYRRSVNSGSSFDPDTQLTTGDSHFPSVAVCDSIVHIVWQDARDGNPEIYYKQSINNGMLWGADERLTDDLANSYHPSVAVCDSIVYVVWYDWRDGNYEIYYNRSVDNGETWGIINKRLTDDPAISYYPSIAVYDSIVHIVWMDKRDGNWEIYYKRSVDNGETWGIIDERLTDDDLANSWYSSIAVCDSIVHVVWYDERAGNYEIYYNRSVDNGETWGIIDERLTNDLAYSGDPSVAVCDSVVHIVWSDGRAGAGNMEIYYNRSVDDGETWGIDERLTNALASSYYPSVACWDCSYDYDVHVTWTDERAGRPEIYYKRHKCEGTSVEERNERLEIRDWRLQIYPNPFIQRTEIRFQISDARCQVSLKIYDMAGRIVKTLVNEERKAGYYNVSFDTEELSPSIYFAKLVVDDYKETRKLILMR